LFPTPAPARLYRVGKRKKDLGDGIAVMDCHTMQSCGSVGDEKDSWLKAIQKDSISMWHNVRISNSDSIKNTESDIKDKYYVRSIPRKILIDRNGIIVGNWIGTSEEIEREVAEKREEMVNK